MKNPILYLIHSHLQKTGVRINILRIKDIYDRHPLPHSIRALSDTLDELHVENMVCTLDFDQLFEIDGPFVVVAGRDEYPFYLVEKLNKEIQEITLHTCVGKRIALTFDQFRAVWDGTVLMAEKSATTKEDNKLTYWIKQGLWFIGNTMKYWIAILAIYILAWGTLQAPAIADLRYVVKFAGFLVSLLVIVKASLAPHLAQRFCRYGKHADCNDVFQSAGAKILGWVSLGELSLAYFSASLVWGLFVAANPAAVFPLLDTLGVLFVVYSLAWQIYHRTWCSLCLLIDFVLVADLGAEVSLWGNFRNMTGFDFYPDFVNFGALFVLSLLSIRTIVAMAEQNLTIPHLKYKKERFLSSPDAFWMLLSKQPVEPIDSNDIPAVCNYIEAEHTITVVMNPSCPKCAKVHEIISKLDGYRINLVFIHNDGDAQSRHAALVMITSGMKYDWGVTNRVIDSWYSKQELPEYLDTHYFAEGDLSAQMGYCQKIHVEGTPTILLDNRRLPEVYDAEDLKVLL